LSWSLLAGDEEGPSLLHRRSTISCFAASVAFYARVESLSCAARRLGEETWFRERPLSLWWSVLSLASCHGDAMSHCSSLAWAHPHLIARA